MRPVIRRLTAMVSAFVLVVLAAAPNLALAGGVPSALAATRFREVVLGPRHVDVRSLPAASSRPSRSAPRLPKFPRPSPTAPRLPSTLTVTPAPPANATSSGALAPAVGNAFDGFDDQNLGTCTPPNCVEPPDPWIAVGPNDVIQVVNMAVRISDRSGSQVANIGLNSFFDVQGLLSNTAFALGDTRILYDAYHQRWAGVELAVDCTSPDNGNNPVGWAIVAVSDGRDPRGSWTVGAWGVADGFPDYPGLGTSRDKIAVSGNVFGLGTGSGADCLNGAGVYAGAKIYAFDWSLSTYQRLPVGSGVYDTTVFAWRPASEVPAVASDPNVYVVGIGLSGNQVVYGALTGTPSGAPLGWPLNMTNQDLGSILAPNLDSPTLPIPSQPGPPNKLGDSAVDARFTDAVWQNGKLWFVSTYPCRPTGQVSATLRDCVRVTKLQTNGTGAPTRLDDFLLQQPDRDLFMGGIGVDGNGTLHVVYSRSSTASGDYISSAAVYQRPADAAGTVSLESPIGAGAGTYLVSDQATGGRWGDYVGVAPDPSDTSSVWQADEYANTLGGWSTKVARLSTPGGMRRLYGSDRYATAVAISAAGFSPGVPAVFIATGTNFPDALAGAAVAGKLGAPVLLVPGLSSTIPLSVQRELGRLHPVDIYVLGGSGAVSDAIKNQLAAYVADASHVGRLGGANRYDTARRIADWFRTKGTFDPNPHVLVATGTNFPDALAGGPLAAKNHGPILLVTSTSVPAETAAALTALVPRDITILGSTGAVSEGVRTALKGYVGGDINKVFRLGGVNRYDTAARIMAATGTGLSAWSGHIDNAFTATGTNFPDALAGAALGGVADGPILLVTPTSVPPETTGALTTGAQPRRITIFGANGVVSDGVKAILAGYIVP